MNSLLFLDTSLVKENKWASVHGKKANKCKKISTSPSPSPGFVFAIVFDVVHVTLKSNCSSDNSLLIEMEKVGALYPYILIHLLDVQVPASS